MKLLIAVTWLLASVTCAFGASCVDPASYARSTVSILASNKYGSGWFYHNNRHIVTIAHAAKDFKLDSSWKEIVLRQRVGDTRYVHTVHARVVATIHAEPEGFVIIELSKSFPQAQVLVLRKGPFAVGSNIVALGYPSGNFRIVEGKFLKMNQKTTYNGESRIRLAPFFETYDRKDRNVMRGGSSGSPILDCEGRVVAVVSAMLTDQKNTKVWGNPNNTGTLIEPLLSYRMP